MKKKILFIIGTLQSGGVSKSLVNLVNTIDCVQNDIHVLLLDSSGDVFSKYLPQNITLHVNQDIEDLHRGFNGIIHLLKRKKLYLALGSMLRMVLSKMSRAKAGILLSRLMPKFTDQTFDLIVDYGGQQQLYYMVDKLNAEKKITFFHNDYSKWTYYYKADKKYYPKVDHIFSISKTCIDSLISFFPNCKEKISIMENISNPNIIHQQALERIEMSLVEKFEQIHRENGTIIATLAHFLRRKGSDFSIEAAKILKDKGIHFIWIFIGKIIETDLLEKIKEYDLENEMIFIGIKSNPYPYIKAIDIYVQPSRYEGKSISLDEAKILCKPIVVTNFSTVYDQFEHGVNATITKMSAFDLSKGIIELIENPNLRNKYKEYLQKHIVDNSDEVNKLYKFINKYSKPNQT